MPQRAIAGLDVWTYDVFDAHAGVFHAVTTRQGGVSASPFESLNLGLRVDDDPAAVAENRARVAMLAGVAPDGVCYASQVHGARVTTVGASDAGTTLPETDALITRQPDLPLIILVADCVAVGLYDPVRRAIGIAHAGWRGTLGDIAGETVAAMGRAFGTKPADLVASVGPSIGPCCYTVGPEVTDAFFADHPEMADDILAPPDFASAGSFEGVAEDRMMLDLWQANELLLVAAGVDPARIEVAHLCTSCETDRFFSHRAENGCTGRFASLIALSA